MTTRRRAQREIQFVIPGEPGGQRRARARAIGNTATVYKDDLERAAEQEVEANWMEGGMVRIDGKVPTWCDVIAYMARPVDHHLSGGELSAKGRREWCPMRKPDGTNIAKRIEDALTHARAWRDDQYVVVGLQIKLWADSPGNPQRPEPCTVVRVRQIKHEDLPTIESLVGWGAAA